MKAYYKIKDREAKQKLKDEIEAQIDETKNNYRTQM